jgi:hypothetical protein
MCLLSLAGQRKRKKPVSRLRKREKSDGTNTHLRFDHLACDFDRGSRSDRQSSQSDGSCGPGSRPVEQRTDISSHATKACDQLFD